MDNLHLNEDYFSLGISASGPVIKNDWEHVGSLSSASSSGFYENTIHPRPVGQYHEISPSGRFVSRLMKRMDHIRVETSSMLAELPDVPTFDPTFLTWDMERRILLNNILQSICDFEKKTQTMVNCDHQQSLRTQQDFFAYPSSKILSPTPGMAATQTILTELGQFAPIGGHLRSVAPFSESYRSNWKESEPYRNDNNNNNTIIPSSILPSKPSSQKLNLNFKFSTQEDVAIKTLPDDQLKGLSSSDPECITRLNQFCQGHRLKPPTYSQKRQSGPAHQPSFHFSASLTLHDCVINVEGEPQSTIKKSKANCAYAIIKILCDNGIYTCE
jgi:hypothetical protein